LQLLQNHQQAMCLIYRRYCEDCHNYHVQFDSNNIYGVTRSELNITLEKMFAYSKHFFSWMMFMKYIHQEIQDKVLKLHHTPDLDEKLQRPSH
jgi:hypothetical protein